MRPKIANLSGLSRRKKVALQLSLDAGIILFSFLSALGIRLESTQFLLHPQIWLTSFATICVTLVVLYWLEFYKTQVRYITGGVFTIVVRAAFVSTVSLYGFGLLFAAGLPRSVPIIHALLFVLLIGGARFVAQYIFQFSSNQGKYPVIIYGAGEVGRQVARSLAHSIDYFAVAFIDDDPKNQGLVVGGLKVYPRHAIAGLTQGGRVGTILLAIPSMAHDQKKELIAELSELHLDIKTVPSLSDLISGVSKVSDFRSVAPEDLLGRDPVAPVQALLQHDITDKVVMVTGAGGSIGGELCRQIFAQSPKCIILFELSEFALYSMETELVETARRLNKNVQIVPILGSVRSQSKLRTVLDAFSVDTIYHAAAYKHVPLVEENVTEGVLNNVFGTLAICLAAKDCGVERFILISTDKAVRPTNVMGATKRIAELICQAMATQESKTVFSMVRFGNVLGSSGSVIPKFQEQIAEGGPVTVTHREVSRFFMTIPEAAQLVIQAGAMAKGGDVFVLDMGEPVKILDLAVSMIKLSGFVPQIVEGTAVVESSQNQIPILVTGLRKGEKLYEELLVGNNPQLTLHPRIMTASEEVMSYEALQSVLGVLRAECDAGNVSGVLKILEELPIEFQSMDHQNSDNIWLAMTSPQMSMDTDQIS